MKIKTAQCPRGLCLKSFISEAIRGVYFLRMRKREKISSSSLKVSNRERKQRRRQRQRKRHPKIEVALLQLKLHRSYCKCFHLSNVCDFLHELNSKGPHLSSQKEKEHRCHVFP